MASFRGLYYPYIHFQDEGWLKTVALYWDEMSRIVPLGTNNKDTDAVKALVDCQFVRNELPANPAITIAKPFRDFLALRGEDLQRRFAMTGSMPGRPFALFQDKLDRALIEDLEYLKLAERRGLWIVMRPQLADVYMTALAEAMAPEIGARPFADQTLQHIAISGLTLERLSDLLLGNRQEGRTPMRDDQEIEQAMATVAFRSVVPAKIADIPIEQIIAFRKVHAAERGQFQAEVRKLIKELEYVKLMSDQDEIHRDLEAAYSKHLAGKVAQIEKAMRRSGWDVIENAIGASWAIPVAVSTGIGALTAAGWGLPAATAQAAAVAFCGWSILRKHGKSKDDALKPSAEAYLYQAKKTLSPQALVQNVRTDSRTFVSHV